MAGNKDNKKAFDLSAPKATEESSPLSAAKEGGAKKAEHKRRSFYITDEQYDAIKLIAATSKDLAEKDQSQIVRTAIDQYLKNRKK